MLSFAYSPFIYLFAYYIIGVSAYKGIVLSVYAIIIQMASSCFLFVLLAIERDGVGDEFFGPGGIFSAVKVHPFPRFQTLVRFKEFLDLL